MGNPLRIPPPGFDELSIDEQMDYVRGLWDHIAESAGNLPLHEWQRKLLEERLAEHEADPSGTLTWEEVLSSVKANLGKA